MKYKLYYYLDLNVNHFLLNAGGWGGGVQKASSLLSGAGLLVDLQKFRSPHFHIGSFSIRKKKSLRCD